MPETGKCKAKIRRIVQSGRSTFYCPPASVESIMSRHETNHHSKPAGQVGIITLNRPKALNALNGQLMPK